MLILDEATSALDYLTERQVCLNLKKAFEGSTVFFITHRLSTIRSSDRILMMDSGSLVEDGTHQELIQQQGRYFALYSQQEPTLTDFQQSEAKTLPSNVKSWEGALLMLSKGDTGPQFLFGCAILFGGSLIWAFAKVDQTITVRGRLEPSGSAREVESP